MLRYANRIIESRIRNTILSWNNVKTNPFYGTMSRLYIWSVNVYFGIILARIRRRRVGLRADKNQYYNNIVMQQSTQTRLNTGPSRGSGVTRGRSFDVSYTVVNESSESDSGRSVCGIRDSSHDDDRRRDRFYGKQTKNNNFFLKQYCYSRRSTVTSVHTSPSVLRVRK